MKITHRWILVSLTLFALPTLGHDMWIVPPESPAGAGDLVKVQLEIGHAGDGDPVSRNNGRIVRFAAFGPEQELAVLGLDGANPAGYFRPGAAGLWSVAYESTPTFSELSAPRFARHLREEGLDAALQLRRQQGLEDAPGRELYSRSLKSLVAVGEPSTWQDRRLGLPLELVVESGLTSEAPIRLRLYLHGQPVEGAKVDVQPLDQHGTLITARTDAEGRVSFELMPGTWMAATVSIEPEASEQADWRSIFATLSFTVPRPVAQ